LLYFAIRDKEVVDNFVRFSCAASAVPDIDCSLATYVT
jgi:hypothetical protein